MQASKFEVVDIDNYRIDQGAGDPGTRVSCRELEAQFDARLALMTPNPGSAAQFRERRKSPCRLRAPETACRAGVWHHQVGDGISSVHAARTRQRAQRVDPDVPGVELEAHGCIASAVRKKNKDIASSTGRQRIGAGNADCLSHCEVKPTDTAAGAQVRQAVRTLRNPARSLVDSSIAQGSPSRRPDMDEYRHCSQAALVAETRSEQEMAIACEVIETAVGDSKDTSTAPQ